MEEARKAIRKLEIGVENLSQSGGYKSRKVQESFDMLNKFCEENDKDLVCIDPKSGKMEQVRKKKNKYN